MCGCRLRIAEAQAWSHVLGDLEHGGCTAVANIWLCIAAWHLKRDARSIDARPEPDVDPSHIEIAPVAPGALEGEPRVTVAVYDGDDAIESWDVDVVVDDEHQTVRHLAKPKESPKRQNFGEATAPGREIASVSAERERLAGVLAARLRAHIGDKPCATE